MGAEVPTPLRLWTLTAALSVIAALLGYLGFVSYLAGQSDFAGAGVADRLYYTLQLFLLDPTPLNGPPYGALLSIAMYLAPFTTVLAVLQAISLAFRDRIAAWALRRKKGHSMVVGAGAEAFVLARRLAASGMVVLVGSDITPDVARRHGVRVVAGDPLDEATLRAAGVRGVSRVFALAEASAVNAGVALLVRSLHRTEVAVHARAEDGELVVALRARRLAAESSTGFRLDFFSLEDVAAVALLDSYDDGQPPTVVGSSRFVRAIVTELARRRRRSGVPLAATVLAEADVTPSLSSAKGTVYISADEPDGVLRTGLGVLLAGHPRVVLCLGRRSLVADALEQRLFDEIGGRLAVFGILDAACDPALLERSALIERLARALHARYLAEYVGGPSVQASHKPWEELDERFKEDNREQAEHIGVKLAAINAVIVPAASGLPAFALRDGGGDSEVERLAVMEHERWMTGKGRADVRYGEHRTDTTHPDMRPWNDGLSDEAKEKDRMFVRNLPALLAAEDLAIVRLAADHLA